MIAFTVLCVIVVMYFVEVFLGSSRTIFGCELGMESRLDEKERMPKREFFGRVVPLVLGVIGLPLMGYSLSEGLLLLAVSAALLIWAYQSRKNVPQV